MNATLYRLKPVKLPKNEFWADPFLFCHNDDHYVFFENYNYKTKIGKISCGKVDKNTLVDIVDVLDLDYHLSFPYIFEEDGEIYLMPETRENNQLELYRSIEFPSKWELVETAFEGEKVMDAYFYDDLENQRWLFVNKQVDDNAPRDCELYIYKVESKDGSLLGNLKPHNLNPVLIDSRSARNGGLIITYKNECYRPSQANMDSIYGRALNIRKIEKLGKKIKVFVSNYRMLIYTYVFDMGYHQYSAFLGGSP